MGQNADADIPLHAPDEGGATLTLREIWESGGGDKPLVLSFGSCSCNMFRQSHVEFERLAREMHGRAVFITVYISEAHPRDGWSFGAMNGRWDIPQAKTLAERQRDCRTWINSIGGGGGPASSYWCDGIDNRAKKHFMSAPDRLYILHGNGNGSGLQVKYQGAPGPFGYDVASARRTLGQLIARG